MAFRRRSISQITRVELLSSNSGSVGCEAMNESIFGLQDSLRPILLEIGLRTRFLERVGENARPFPRSASLARALSFRVCYVSAHTLHLRSMVVPLLRVLKKSAGREAENSLSGLIQRVSRRNTNWSDNPTKDRHRLTTIPLCPTCLAPYWLNHSYVAF